MSDSIERVEIFTLTIPRDTPYLGPLESGVRQTDKGLFVRPGNRSVYSIHDHSVVVRVTTRDGVVGWGEGWAIVAPEVAATILRDLLAPFVIGRDPQDAVAIYEDLYDAMRVRGFFGGFYLDAIAALDIAIWDCKARAVNLPICKVLGAQRHTRIPAYVSGLPRPHLTERAELAREWSERGFTAVKFAAAVASEGEIREIEAIRKAAGDDLRILCDFHWRYSAGEAIRLISAIEPYDLYVAEAPCHSEDLAGQAAVARAVKTPLALGEEWHTPHEFLPRFEQRCMSYIQPEIAHTGLTNFWHVCQMSNSFHMQVMPHASIGIGLFQAASLQVSAALNNIVYHEYQHSIFDRNLRFVTGSMRCESGFYTVPDGPGLGVEPTDEAFAYLQPFN
jgi:galactonate dehydratase